MKYILDSEMFLGILKELEPVHRNGYIMAWAVNLVSGTALPPWASKLTATAKAKADGDYSADFEEFWKAYPKRTAKGAAYTEWKKIKMDKMLLSAKCIQAIEWQKTSQQWSKDNGMYIPNPSTYLSQRRWEDERIIQQQSNRFLDCNGIWRTREL